jgi:tetratricopeptide (TPR) repeat protein
MQWKSLLSLLKADSVYLTESWFGSYLYANQVFVEVGVDKKLLKQKEINEIIKYSDNAIRLYRGKPEPFYLNGRVYDEVLNNQVQAGIYFLEAALLDSTNSEYTFRAARALQLSARPEDAVRWYRITIRIFPGSIYSYYYLSQIEYERRNVGVAYSICGEMIRLFPDSYLPYLNLGVFRFHEGNTDLSAEMYSTAVDKGFRGKEILSALAQHYRAKGSVLKAEKYEKMLAQ